MFTGVAIEYREESLAVDSCEGDDYGVCILHEAPGAFSVGDGALEDESVWQW